MYMRLGLRSRRLGSLNPLVVASDAELGLFTVVRCVTAKATRGDDEERRRSQPVANQGPISPPIRTVLFWSVLFRAQDSLPRATGNENNHQRTPRHNGQHPRAWALMLPCRRGHGAACLLLVLAILSCASPTAAGRPAPEHGQHDGAAWHSFKHLQDARRGNHVTGLGDLKRYLAKFGYMPAGPEHGGEPTDAFDEHLEAAVKRYQSRLSLPVTGRLDAATLDQIMSPRCGVEDDHGASVSPEHGGGGAVSRFTFFKGEPRWTRRSDPIVLTYAVSPKATVSYLQPDDVRAVFRRAFQRWALVIPVSFVETEDYDEADIRLGFYKGSHGDGVPFDGPLGVLGHAFSPKNGRLHLDASEQWALSFGDGMETSSESIHLESVATHEIGHVLGLGHSTSPKAVMYPSIKPLQTKADLTVDDVEGVQLLYGSNPDFRLSSLYNEMDTSMSSERSSWVAYAARLLVGAVLIILVTHL